MKIYGGNGHRVKNSGRNSASERTAYTGRDNIKKPDNGHNNIELQNNSRSVPQKKGSAGKAFLTVFLVIAFIVGGAYAYWKITTKPPEVDTQGGNENGQTDNKDTTPNVVDTPTREIGRYYTILVVGKDQIQSNTDTIMVARYDAVEHKVNVVSIPRDTLVNVSWPLKKINTIYFRDNGGIEALMDGVKDILGFRPDSYVVVDTNIFEKVIDTLGGVYFDVPVDMNYDDPEQNLSIHIPKGYQWLNGENALKVFRYREGYAMADIDRLEVQHNLIKACAEQMLKLNNIDKLLAAAKIVSDNAETNLTYGNLQWYAQEFLKMSMENISIVTIPANYSCSVRNVSYVSINVDEWIAMVNESLNPLKQPIKPEDCNILYQITPDASYDPVPENYAVTNGGEVAGGLNSFFKGKR
ncbi:MAG: LCP family protein [Clostridiales bacterium]|nr:LCP family protein [Clostridiales bacterium]